MAKLNPKIKHAHPDGRYFLSSEMIAEAKRDEAAWNAEAKRKGKDKPTILHTTCSCGCGIVTHAIEK